MTKIPNSQFPSFRIESSQENSIDETNNLLVEEVDRYKSTSRSRLSFMKNKLKMSPRAIQSGESPIVKLKPRVDGWMNKDLDIPQDFHHVLSSFDSQPTQWREVFSIHISKPSSNEFKAKSRAWRSVDVTQDDCRMVLADIDNEFLNKFTSVRAMLNEKKSVWTQWGHLMLDKLSPLQTS